MTQIKETTRQNEFTESQTKLNGHVSINFDERVFRYDIDRNIPIVLVGVQPCERLREEVGKAEEKGLTGIRIAIRGGDTFILDYSDFDKLDQYIKTFSEIVSDLNAIKKNIKPKTDDKKTE